ELEEMLDRGFFISFIGKIVVDEKRVYSVLNELRAAAREALGGIKARTSGAGGQPARGGLPVEAGAGAGPEIRTAEEEARRIRDGADRYAEQALGELEERLNSILGAVRRGREMLDKRIHGGEVK
ncbi:MAG: hypothetical protein AB1742_06890, partial [bacterium]